MSFSVDTVDNPVVFDKQIKIVEEDTGQRWETDTKKRGSLVCEVKARRYLLYTLRLYKQWN